MRLILTGICTFGAYGLSMLAVPFLFSTGIDVPGVEISQQVLVYGLSGGVGLAAFLMLD